MICYELCKGNWSQTPRGFTNMVHSLTNIMPHTSHASNVCLAVRNANVDTTLEIYLVNGEHTFVTVDMKQNEQART
jgi:hypothetical protein